METCHPSRDHRPWHGKQAKDFSLIPSVSTYLPIPGSYKCQTSQPRDKHLCVGTSQSEIISQHLCPAAVPLEMWHRACTHAAPQDKSPFSQQWCDKCPFLTLDLQIEGNDEGKKKKICFLTSCKLEKKKKDLTISSSQLEMHQTHRKEHMSTGMFVAECPEHVLLRNPNS